MYENINFFSHRLCFDEGEEKQIESLKIDKYKILNKLFFTCIRRFVKKVFEI